jgi:hypothetical protein
MEGTLSGSLGRMGSGINTNKFTVSV